MLNLALPCVLLKPCQNNGACINDNAGVFTCVCQIGYTGKTCETRLNNKYILHSFVRIKHFFSHSFPFRTTMRSKFTYLFEQWRL